MIKEWIKDLFKGKTKELRKIIVRSANSRQRYKDWGAPINYEGLDYPMHKPRT